eukprot:m.21495 g.21495  ORF g.21495 m.21495 type:complete len:78 (-) comp10723_c0_seq1:1208-1441(-)
MHQQMSEFLAMPMGGNDPKKDVFMTIHEMSCWERGKAAEKLFAEIAEQHGYKVTWASAKEDRAEHKDLKITRGLCDS